MKSGPASREVSPFRLTWATPIGWPRSRIGTVTIFWIGDGLSRSLMLSKNATCLTIGTLFITSPARRASTPTAIESRFVTGIEPRSAKRRGATKRRWRPSEDSRRIATSSCLQENSLADHLHDPVPHVEQQLAPVGNLVPLAGHRRQDLLKLEHFASRRGSWRGIIPHT